MQKKKLGKTNLDVSVIGFGGIPVQRISHEEAKLVVRAAVDKGLNFFDTARNYTDSEEKIGSALKGLRHKIVIATKALGRDKDTMEKEIELSLKNFQTDYIDLYQFHNVKTEQDLEKILGPGGALEALVQAKEQGKIRYIGITGHVEKTLIKALDAFEFSTVQFPRNYIEDTAEKELFPLARKKNMGIIIMKPLAGGAFSNTNLALRYLLGQDYSTVIPGMDTIEQINANLDLGINFIPLSKEEVIKLEQEAQELGPKFCRRCEYCKPCPQGLDITEFFIIHTYFKRYGLKDRIITRYNNMSIMADQCIECGICETKCPYELPIKKMLKEIHADLKI
ncbi:MAG: aldo/keto reductase [Clostridiaceae bacterium BRH_c20a]|nr:MAG: aldo/keto reductase [Clostridiaceae bacterium BRH_c20a]